MMDLMIDREVKSARTIFFLLQRRQTLEYEKPRPDNATDSSKLQDNTKQRERELSHALLSAVLQRYL